MSLKGMDTDAVRQLAGHMTNAQQQIEAIRTQLTNQLQTVQWLGPDREQFVSDWNAQHVAALNSVCTALSDASMRATHNAIEQDQVSAN